MSRNSNKLLIYLFFSILSINKVVDVPIKLSYSKLNCDLVYVKIFKTVYYALFLKRESNALYKIYKSLNQLLFYKLLL